jgi:hypothetical protein
MIGGPLLAIGMVVVMALMWYWFDYGRDEGSDE